MALQVACEQFITPNEITCECGDLNDEAKGLLIDSASDILAILTGGKVQGQCEDPFRPCRRGYCSCGSSYLSGCGCVDGITLPSPINSIEILIDGDPFDAWAIVDGNQLIRTDGRGWPTSQNLKLEPTEVGTFEITITHGEEISELAKRAAAEIVCSFIQSSPQSTRKTNPNTRSMSIAGVQITLDQQVMEIKRRSFMLPNVVRLITVYAPGGPSPAFVYSPELEGGWILHRVTYPTGS